MFLGGLKLVDVVFVLAKAVLCGVFPLLDANVL